jgi:hypothetical protein
MQVCDTGLNKISFDLGDNTKWEFVMLDHTQTGAANPDNGEEEVNEAVSEDEDDKGNPEIVDMPPSWVERLNITKEQFESRCPFGSKIIMYEDAKWEKFGDYYRKGIYF